MQVDLGDGRIVEFPDDLPKDQVNAAIAKMMRGGAAAPTPTPDPGWSVGRVVRDVLHYPAMGLQIAGNAGSALVNAPFQAASLVGRVVDPLFFNKDFLQQEYSDPTKTVNAPWLNEGPLHPYAGANAQPSGPGEAYVASGLTGLGTALLGGALSRSGAVMEALKRGGKDIASALPSLLGEGVTRGAIPAVAAEAVNQNFDLDSLGPQGKAAAELGIGAASALVAHSAHRAIQAATGTSPVEAVAAGLGKSRNTDEAGDAAAANVQQWRKGLSAKLEELKRTLYGPVGQGTSSPDAVPSAPSKLAPGAYVGSFKTDAAKVPNPPVQSPDVHAGDTTHDTMLFGKVPLGSAEIDNSSTLRTTHALANEGGVYNDFYHNFVSKLPEGVQTLFDHIALSNKPIEAFGPKRQGRPGPPTYKVGEVPGEQNTYGPVLDLDATHEPQGPGLQGGWEVPRSGAPEAEGRPGVGPGGSQGPQPFTHAGAERDTGYRPNWTFGVNNPPEAPPSSPLVNPEATPATPPRWNKRNARGQFVSKGYGVEEPPPPPPPPQGPPPGPPEPPPPPPNPNPVVPYAPNPEAAPAGTVTPDSTIIGFKAPLADAMKLRSAIGEWLSNPKLMPKGVDEAHAKAYYAALSDDIGRTMQDHNAGPEWQNYNTEATKVYHAGNLLSKFASDVNPERNDVAGGKAVKQVWNGMLTDSGEIRNLREQVPEAANEIAAAYLRQQPEQWHELQRRNPDAARALVPNPFDRMTLDLNAKAKTSLTSQIAHGGAMGGMGAAGYALGEALKSYGFSHEGNAVMSPGLWAALGILAPPALSAVGRTVKNPAKLAGPVMGAVAGHAGAEGGGPQRPTSPLLNSTTQ